MSRLDTVRTGRVEDWLALRSQWTVGTTARCGARRWRRARSTDGGDSGGEPR